MAEYADPNVLALLATRRRRSPLLSLPGDDEVPSVNPADVASAPRVRGTGVPADQGSRTAGEGSRNYVVFDDALVEIMRKYGIAPFALGAGAASYDGQGQ